MKTITGSAVIKIEFSSRTLYFSTKQIYLNKLPIMGICTRITETRGSFLWDELPLDIQKASWVNRAVTVYDLLATDTSLGSKNIIASGIIPLHPTRVGGILEVLIVEKTVKRLTIPSTVISSTAYPNAGKSVIGEDIPHIFGEVEKAELLPINLPVFSNLTEEAEAGDTSISIEDSDAFPENGSFHLGEGTYTYTSKADGKLIGCDIQGSYPQGSTVAMSGQATYIAAEHGVQKIAKVLVDEASPILPSTIDLEQATVSFSKLVTSIHEGGKENVIAEFDNVDATNTATQSTNAIRAVTATDTNILSTSLPFTMNTGEVELTRTGVLDFPAPSQDKILLGTYGATFSVNHNNNTGTATVRIGGVLVWVLNSGVVVYSASPATFFYHESTNQLPVAIQRDSLSGSIDLTISNSSRTISLGNLDSALYGQIASGQQFVANQTTVMPDKGRISEAKLGVEWFSTDDFLGTASVYFDDVLLGSLKADNVTGQTLNETINIDVSSGGDAALAASNINVVTNVSGGTAAITNSPIIQRQSFGATYAWRVSGLIFRAEVKFRPPENVVTGLGILHTLRINSSQGEILYGGFSQDDVEIYDSSSRIKNLVSDGLLSTAVVVSSNTTEVTIRHDITNVPSADLLLTIIQMMSIEVEWQVNKTDVNSVAASGNSTTSVPDPTLPLTINNFVSGNKVISLDVPAPPRTIINSFALPKAALDQWDYFTGKQVKIVYTGGGVEKVALLRVVLLVNYKKLTYKIAKKLTATVKGSSDNPADVLKEILAVSGELMSSSSHLSLANWCTVNNYTYNRRFANKSDALTILTFALAQLHSFKSVSRGVSEIYRLLDISGEITSLTTEDFIGDVLITPSKDLFNDVSIEFYAGEDKTLLQANPTNNVVCAKSLRELLENIPTHKRTNWFSNVTTAQQFLDNYVKIYSKVRLILKGELPFDSPLAEVNKLAVFEDKLFKVVDVTSLDYPKVTLQEIPFPMEQ